MKKIILILITTLFVFSCDKEEEEQEQDSQNNLLQASVNGETLDFNILPIADIDPENSLAQFGISGSIINTSNDTIVLVIAFLFDDENGELVETSYNESSCLNQEICPIMGYGRVIGNLGAPFVSHYQNNDVKINFTSLRYEVGGEAVGTFSGTLYDDGNENFVSISDGKFDLVIE